MKIMSFNVNGIRAVYKKGFVEFVEREQPDILCVQETKANKDQCEPGIINPDGMLSYWSSGIRKGYSGTATFVRKEPKGTASGIGISEYDSEGRFVITDHGDFTLYNIYFPNGGSGPERHDFKQKFLRDLNEHLKPLVDGGRPLIVVGDYNVARKPIDVYDPVKLADESGFLPEERDWFDSFLELGFVDTYRHFHPDARDKFTWWSARERARMGNRGWRIDYICVTKNLVSRLRSADILDRIETSDHCPITVELS
ncbi:MAG TPA: exodeoxyribonuclease III [Bdellovibrionales bacterium]|jgi:exodeoxyribonuclease-3|nr:exodeoxyribonuclease III [Bdellovibrionales bacterium]